MVRRKDLTIEAINQRLKAAKIGVRVMQRGDRLSLQATLPPKPDSGKTKPHQQVVALGIYANPAGLENAEARALELGGLLARQSFDWAAWGDDGTPPSDTAASWIDRYRDHYLKVRQDDPNAEWKWHEREWLYLKHLAQARSLDADAIVRAVTRTRPNTRNRQLACQALGRFADFAKVEVKLDQLVGNYSPKRREIPSDEEIVAAIDRIPNPQWKAIAALMATYGLRDHEAFLCSVKRVRGVAIARVPEECKTAERDVRPLRPEWVDRWGLLGAIEKPATKGTRMRDYGNLTSRAFRRYHMGFTPYDLRHAYALRAVIYYKLPYPIAANMLGHSVSVLTSTYSRWLRADQVERVYEEMVLRED